jgi:hypothetical protein
MSFDYGYGPSIGFLRFCDDPELACCQAEKDYLRLKAQEIGLYEKAMELEYELTLLRKVADLVSTMQESESGYSARLAEIEMLKVLDEYQTWKEGQDGKSI